MTERLAKARPGVKRLALVRHAKAEPFADGGDFERALAERGLADAKAVAKRLKDAGFDAGFLLSSPAKRALQTARIFAEALGCENIATDASLYEAGPREILAAAKALPDEFGSAMIFAHNPSIGELAALLNPALDAGMPTCAVVCVDFETDSWRGLSESVARPRLALSPKSL